MRIGLFDVDSKIPNLALMKLSAFHKKKGDKVEFYSPLFHNSYDKIYASKIFTFDNKFKHYLQKDMIIGGSGYNSKIKLPNEIEHIYPDYELYKCEYAIGYITRGCIRNCEFCIVREKEGNIHKHSDLEEFCKDQENVLLFDNNILSYKDHIIEIEKLAKTGKKFDFNQGLDIRLITSENAKVIKKLKKWEGTRFRFSLDSPNLINLVEKKMEILNNCGINNGSLFFYVLIGFNTTPEDDMKRVNFLKSKGCSIYIMPYKKNRYVRKFKRWVNGYFYKYESFKDYLDGVRN